MAYHGTTLPSASNDAAREAKRKFFCELCQKGYARMNELETHEGSYDHQHRKRMKDMKALMRDTSAPAKREAERRAEEKASGMRLNITSSDTANNSSAPPRKAPVFKKIGAAQGSSTAGGKVDGAVAGERQGGKDAEGRARVMSDDPTQAKANGWYDVRYRPGIITASKRCGSECRVCQGQDMVLAAVDDVNFDGHSVEPGGTGTWRQWWED